MATTFGPSALATPANAVTLGRLGLSPLLWALIIFDGPSFVAVIIWIALAATDGLDGWVARRSGTTRSGAFLDPLADKVLVLGALWSIVVAGGIWWLPVGLITVRELAISAFRSYWARRGLAVPARFWAKVKTVVQAVAVGAALFPPFVDGPDWIVPSILWLATALTVVTGVQYVLEGSSSTSTGGVRS